MVLLVAACGSKAAAPGLAKAADVLAVQDTAPAQPGPDVASVADFDPDGAYGYAKSKPMMVPDIPPRFQIPSTFQVGAWKPGVFVLPNGRLLTPMGKQVELGSYPMGVLAHPNGKWVYISNDGLVSDKGTDTTSIQVYDVAQGKVVQSFERPNLYRFLAFSPDGQSLYASGGPMATTWQLAIAADGTLSEKRAYDTARGFYGIGVSPDGKFLYGLSSYVALSGKGSLQAITKLDAETGEQLGIANVATGPYDLAMAPDGQHAFLVTWRDGKVQRVDLAGPATPTDADTAALGVNGQGIAISPDGKHLWASAVEGDKVVEFDPATMQKVRDIPVGLILFDQPLMAPRGRDPGLMAVSPDGKRLYVVCAMSNEVIVIATQAGVVIGSIPVGWYPSGVSVSPDGKTLYVVNAKGTGIPPWKQSGTVEASYAGTMSVIPLPDDNESLLDGSLAVLDNMIGVSGVGRLQPEPGALKVLPDKDKSPVLHHVVYIMRENKTFDVELGDLGALQKDVHADPQYTLFGEEFTPNLHQLAAQFCVLDNFYTDGDYSATGHSYAVDSKASDYIEKFYNLDGKGIDFAWGVSPTSRPAGGSVFTNLLAHGYMPMSFGEIVGMSDSFLVSQVMNLDWPGAAFNLDVSDESKAAWFEDWLKGHELPAFSFILLPANHTCCGGDPTHESPRSMVADNDAATGRIVAAITQSPAWNDTAIFIFEDDPQDGGDSIAYHRSPLIVVSPYAKRGYVDHTHHATGSIHATMERILDVTPLTELDGYASPVYGCFTDKADNSAFQHADRLYPVTLNAGEKKTGGGFEAIWNAMDFTKPDQNRGLGRVLWQMYKGTAAPWRDVRLTPGGRDVDADD